MADFNAVKDSGQREDFATGSRRDTRDGKGRYDLLPVRALRRIAKHYENGAVKYGDRNWEKGQPLCRYLDSALRHTFAILEGKADEDHAAAAAWNLMAFIETAERIEAGMLPESLDDRPPLAPQEEADDPQLRECRTCQSRNTQADAPPCNSCWGVPGHPKYSPIGKDHA